MKLIKRRTEMALQIHHGDIGIVIMGVIVAVVVDVAVQEMAEAIRS